MKLKYYTHFYKLDDITCRRYLDIKTDNSENTSHSPDIILICLNPGSCKSDILNKEIELTKTDPTISRISKLIGIGDIKYIRLLNLSDIKDPFSERFFNNPHIKTNKKHSIFSDCNKNILKDLVLTNSKVLLAWGVNDKNKELAEMAFKALKEISVKILNENEPYYHPLKRFTKEKPEESWFEQTKKVLLNN
ncbi:MAG: DUF1643 domain-containing protein [Bacteroidota bacterium]